MKKKQSIYSDELYSYNDLIKLDKATNLSKQSFWHYTTAETVKKILNGGTLQLSNLLSANDKHEKTTHNGNPLFVTCFCNSSSEKIPLWYLYSGIEGKGASIKFTPSVMLELIKSINTATLLYGENGAITLTSNTDFTVKYGWIYYRVSSNPKEINYKNQWYVLMDSDTPNIESCFIKDYPWEYEKEFRIVIEITNKNIHRYINDKSKISIKLPELTIHKLEVKLAPEFNTSNIELEKYKNKLKELGISSVTSSDLAIKMNLLERYHNELNIIERQQ